MRPVYRYSIGLICVVAIAATGYRLHWAYHNWVGFQFTAACEHYEPNPGDYISELTFVEGELTDEFWAIATRKLERFVGFEFSPADKIRIVDGKIFSTSSLYFISEAMAKKFQGQREEWFVWVSGEVAREILTNRKAAGAFTQKDQEAFMIYRRDSRLTVPMAPNECGFMEELILKGGRFASE